MASPCDTVGHNEDPPRAPSAVRTRLSDFAWAWRLGRKNRSKALKLLIWRKEIEAQRPRFRLRWRGFSAKKARFANKKPPIRPQP
jgi:hypothetical protein